MTDVIEKLLNNFDNNVKVIEYFCELETYLNLADTQKNINKINTLLLESSRIVYHFNSS
jgi:hypothetical protein